MFRLSACADTLFQALPFEQRAREIARSGFLVEFWRWPERPLEALADDPEIRISAFTGYLGGCIVHPDGVESYLAGLEASLPVARRLGCRELFISTGQLDQRGQVAHPIAAHPATRYITAYQALCRAAELAEKHDMTYHLEHLNTKVDHPGYPLPYVEDAVRLIEAVGSPRIRLLLDTYHVQIEEGNLVETIRSAGPYIGYVHVADVPGRHEPGTGEINYRRVAQALREAGYAGTVGLEAYPAAGDQQALERFREAFV
jgi:hydroxypyruvate isomerase